MLLALTLLYFTSCNLADDVMALKSSSYIAAVYAHHPFLTLPGIHWTGTRTQALQLMTVNLEVYNVQAELAKSKGADILVFPEDGLYGMYHTRQSILPFLETIPDPGKVTRNPCTQNQHYPNTEIQRNLSCMARVNKLYIVANMADLVSCQDTVLDCPQNGHFQYDTDVVFDPEGNLVAKYHKSHLRYELQFDVPKPEVAYFDTPFGRFGLITSMDMLYEKPAVTLVTQYNVTNIAFPTAWMDDRLPLLSAVGYHSSFAMGLRVNVLAANIHLPAARYHGSGIYSPRGAAVHYFDDDHKSTPRLLTAEVFTHYLPKTNTHLTRETIKHIKNKNSIFNKVTSSHLRRHEKLKNYTRDVGVLHSLLTYLNYSGDYDFYTKVLGDLYTFKSLNTSSGSLKVCQRGLCCLLEYKFFNNILPTRDLFAFGVFDGIHKDISEQFYLQACALLKCANTFSRSTCGQKSTNSSSKFESFSISGNFETNYVYPQVVMVKSRKLTLAKIGAISFGGNNMSSSSNLRFPVLSAILLGRDYLRD